jgi:alcohol dehydrogenase class IV
MTDAFCREGMLRATRSLRRAYKQGSDIGAREDMSLVSLFGGLALANAGLGAVHGFAGPIGGMFSAPHGAICGRLLPHVMAVNVCALKERLPKSGALRRYDQIARILIGSGSASASDGVAWAQELCDELQIPTLAAYDIAPNHFPLIIEKASASSSMQRNPIKLTPDEMQEILTRAL